jgi:hypothetical protein
MAGARISVKQFTISGSLRLKPEVASFLIDKVNATDISLL